MASAVVGQLLIELSANVARLQSDMNEAKGAVKQASEDMSAAIDTVKTAFETLGVGLSVAGLKEFVMNSVDAGEAMHALSQKTGIAVNDLAGLQLAAEMNSSSLDEVATGVKKLSTFMFDAEKGGQAQIDMLHALGVTAREPLPAMEQIADQFAKMPDGAEKSAIAVKLFGSKVGTDMIPMLNHGGDALRAMMDEGERLNPVTAEFTERSKQFSDDLAKIRAGARGNAMAFTNELLPGLTDISEAFLKSSNQSNLFADAGHGVSLVVKDLTLGLSTIAFVLKQDGELLGAMGAGLAALGQGDLAAVGKIATAFKDQFVQAKDEYVNFVTEIVGGQQKISEAAAGQKTDNSVINRIKQLGDLRKAEEDQKKLEEEIFQAHANQMVYDLNQAERQKVLDAEAAKRLAAKLLEEQQYFSKVQALANQNDNTAQSKEQTRFQNDVNDWQKRYALAQENHVLSLAEEEGFQATMDNIIKIHRDKQFQDGLSAFEQQLGQAGKQYRVLFEIDKEYRTAKAVIEGWHAVQAAYAWGAEFGGPIGGAAAAAVAFAATAANVMAIQGASFGGGSGMSGGGSGGAPLTTSSPLAPSVPVGTTAGVAQPAQAASQVNLTIVGNDNTTFTYDQIVNQLIPVLNQAAGNGVNIKVALA